MTSGDKCKLMSAINKIGDVYWLDEEMDRDRRAEALEALHRVMQYLVQYPVDDGWTDPLTGEDVRKQ